MGRRLPGRGMPLPAGRAMRLVDGGRRPEGREEEEEEGTVLEAGTTGCLAGCWGGYAERPCN